MVGERKSGTNRNSGNNFIIGVWKRDNYRNRKSGGREKEYKDKAEW